MYCTLSCVARTHAGSVPAEWSPLSVVIPCDTVGTWQLAAVSAHPGLFCCQQRHTCVCVCVQLLLGDVGGGAIAAGHVRGRMCVHALCCNAHNDIVVGRGNGASWQLACDFQVRQKGAAQRSIY